MKKSTNSGITRSMKLKAAKRKKKQIERSFKDQGDYDYTYKTRSLYKHRG